MGRTVTPGVRHVDEEVGEPPVPLGLGVGPEQAEAPLGERPPRRHVFWPVSIQPPSPSERRPGCGCRPGRCRRRAPTSPGTRSPRPRPWAAGTAPLGVGAELEMVGASRKTPFWLTRSGAWARQYSSSKISHSRMPDPPAAELLGPGDDRPAVGVHGLLPGPVGLEARRPCRGRAGERGAGAWSASQARASARNASWASVKRRSIGRSIGSVPGARLGHPRPASAVDREI